MTEDEWYETYKPIKNGIDSTSSWNDHMFETYGDDVDFVNNQPYENIWTWVSGDDGGTYLVSGRYYINRIGYFVTEVPFPDNTTIQIQVGVPWYFCEACDSKLIIL